MIGSHLLVSFNKATRDYPKVEKIAAIFEIHGEIRSILSDEKFKNYFFVNFESDASALECYESRAEHYSQHGYIIEHVDIQCPEEFRGADTNIPSLLDLNDDCLLHLLKFLSEEESIKYVCTRLRRLYFSQWRGLTQMRINKKKHHLDKIYHCGNSITHIYFDDFYESSIDEMLRFVLLRCSNIKHLHIDGPALQMKTLRILKKSKSLSELFFKNCNLDKLFSIAPLGALNNLRKLKFFQSLNDDIIIPSRLKNKSLTAIIMPDIFLDAGEILREFPSLKALSCQFNKKISECPSEHNLQELGCDIDFTPESLTNVLKVRKCCPNLRYLRVSRDNYFELDPEEECKIDNLEELLPLEGLCLPSSQMENRIHLVADKLKFLFLDQPGEHHNYHLMLSQYSNLEIIIWDRHVNGEFEEFLRRRNSSLPLTVLSVYDFDPKHATLLPNLKWVNDPEEIFGQFSIFSGRVGDVIY